MKVRDGAEFLLSLFVEDCRRDGVATTDNAWASWLKRAREHKPQLTPMAKAVRGAFK